MKMFPGKKKENVHVYNYIYIYEYIYLLSIIRQANIVHINISKLTHALFSIIY